MAVVRLSVESEGSALGVWLGSRHATVGLSQLIERQQGSSLILVEVDGQQVQLLARRLNGDFIGIGVDWPNTLGAERDGEVCTHSWALFQFNNGKLHNLRLYGVDLYDEARAAAVLSLLHALVWRDRHPRGGSGP